MDIHVGGNDPKARYTFSVWRDCAQLEVQLVLAGQHVVESDGLVRLEIRVKPFAATLAPAGFILIRLVPPPTDRILAARSDFFGNARRRDRQ